MTGAAVGIKLADRTNTDTVDTFQALLVSLTAPPSSAEDMRTPAAAVTSQPAAQPASLSQYDATQSPAQPANTLHSDTTQPPTYMPTSYSSGRLFSVILVNIFSWCFLEKFLM